MRKVKVFHPNHEAGYAFSAKYTLNTSYRMSWQIWQIFCVQSLHIGRIYFGNTVANFQTSRYFVWCVVLLCSEICPRGKIGTKQIGNKLNRFSVDVIYTALTPNVMNLNLLGFTHEFAHEIIWLCTFLSDIFQNPVQDLLLEDFSVFGFHYTCEVLKIFWFTMSSVCFVV